MAFHFFTDYNLLDHQLQKTNVEFITAQYTAAFGKILYPNPNIASDYDALLLTSTHRSNSDTVQPFAYAICDGIIAIAPVKHSNLVNIILKPLEQPNLPLPKVKYFIYRGVLRDSIFTDPLNTPANQQSNSDFPSQSDDIEYVIGNADPNQTSNLIESIQFHSQTQNPNSHPISSDIFLYNDIKEADENLEYLDSLFVNRDDNYGANWHVKGGWILGNFPSKNNSAAGNRLDRFTVIPVQDTNFYYGFLNIFGLEIILDTLDYNPMLNLVKRSARVQLSNAGIRNFNIIPIEEYGLTGFDSSNKVKHLVKQLSIEPALNYMDPAAFFGSFYRMYSGNSREDFNYQLRARKHNDLFNPLVEGVATPQFSVLTSNEIYQKILKGENLTKINFANKNRIYFDIRNNYNDSYNFYNDNCYNENPSDPNSEDLKSVYKNILYRINDGKTNAQRVIAARDYYNFNNNNGLNRVRELPWMVFDAHDYELCDTQIRDVAYYDNQFCNNDLTQRYSVTLQFPTVSSPYIEQYSLFQLLDKQWLNDASLNRIELSANNRSDNNLSSNIYHLNYAENSPVTDEVNIMVNTYDNPASLRVPVAAYHRFCFLKHRTKLDAPGTIIHNPTDLKPELIVVPRPIQDEFMDNVFNMNMILTYGITTGGVVQTRASEELRYADTTRASGWDYLGQTGIAKDAFGVVFFINGQYQRQSTNVVRTSLNEVANIYLLINSRVVTSPIAFLSLLQNTAASIPNDTGTGEIPGLRYSGSPGIDESLNLVVQASFGLNTTKQLEFFSFVRIPQDHWSLIDTYYKALINGTKYHKIYLCFNKKTQPCNQPNRYEYYFRGFNVTQTGTTGQYTIHIIQPNAFTLSNPTIEYVNNYKTFGIENYEGLFFQRARQGVYSPASFTNTGGNVTMQSDIYMMRSLELTYPAFYQTTLAIKRELAQVYTSYSQSKTAPSNKGLLDIINDPLLNINDINFSANMLQSIPPKFMFLRNKEIMFFLGCRPSNPEQFGRSHANERTASLFFEPITGNNFLNKFTAAHEYGHILGLGDRYGYQALMVQGDNYLIDDGAGIPLYIAGDTEYNTNYRWFFNLMSLANQVPASSEFGTLPFGTESNFIDMYNPQPSDPTHPDNYIPSGTVDEFGYHQNISIFLTPAQWRRIANGTAEPAYFGQRTVFLFPATAAGVVSFVGNQNTDGSGPSFSDHQFPGNSGNMSDRQNTPALGWVTYNNENEILADTNLRDEVERGGFFSQGLITLGAGTFDLRGTNEAYLNIVTTLRNTRPEGLGGGASDLNNYGLNVWIHTRPIDRNKEGNPRTNPALRVFYDNHPNRLKIIRIISRGT